MDMSIRFMANELLIEKLRCRTENIEPLPIAQEIYYLPSVHGNITEQFALGVIRLRDLNGATVELSCNRRNYKNIGYEHEKFVLFVGPKVKVAYLINVLGLKEIGRIEQKSQYIHLNSFDENIHCLHAISTSGNKSVTTVKLEAKTEEDLLLGLNLLGLDLSKLDQIDPISYLLAGSNY